MKKLLNNKLLWKCILVVYIIIVFVFVVLKLYTPNGNILFTRNLILQNRSDGYWNINLIPFHSIQSYFENGLNFKNILGNTIPFVLLGFLFSIAQRDKIKITKLLAFCLILILSFEVIQFVLCVGFFDIDDIILNEFSCLLGIILFKRIKAIC